MIFNLLIIDAHRDANSFIDVLGIGTWSLFYIEWLPKHAGGGISFLTILGKRIK